MVTQNFSEQAQETERTTVHSAMTPEESFWNMVWPFLHPALESDCEKLRDGFEPTRQDELPPLSGE